MLLAAVVAAAAGPTVKARVVGSKLYLLLRAKDNVKRAKYRVLFNGRVVKVAQHGYRLLAARAGTFRVVAVDTAGNKSKPSAAVKVVRHKRGFSILGSTLTFSG